MKTTLSLSMTKKQKGEQLDALMAKIREQIVKHGGGALAGLTRKFRISDDNGDKKIDLENELPKMIAEIKVSITSDEMNQLKELLDFDRNGSIDFEEFLYHLAPPMSATRIEWVNKVFDKLDIDHSGLISKQDLAHALNCDSRYNHICRLCDKNGNGNIDRQELIDYYREISPSIDSDEYFIAMLQSAWKNLNLQ